MNWQKAVVVSSVLNKNKRKKILNLFLVIPSQITYCIVVKKLLAIMVIQSVGNWGNICYTPFSPHHDCVLYGELLGCIVAVFKRLV